MKDLWQPGQQEEAEPLRQPDPPALRSSCRIRSNAAEGMEDKADGGGNAQDRRADARATEEVGLSSLLRKAEPMNICCLQPN